jgi:lipopolysaccharide biosynthesis glycosyltransferase
VSKCIKIFVGFDQKEAIAYHTFSQSLIQRSSIPLSITPLADNTLNMYNETHQDGTNKFTYSRFLIPYLMNFKGFAIFADGDMVCQSDIKKLYDLYDKDYAVQVVKHNYKTKYKDKYLGQKNENYPRKNWSSLIIWNCSHPKNKILTPKLISEKNGSFLHRFSWLDDNDIGELDKSWNWLAMEYPEKNDVDIIHYTLGTPCFKDYETTSLSSHWHENFNSLLEGHYKKIL